MRNKSRFPFRFIRGIITDAYSRVGRSQHLHITFIEITNIQIQY